MPFLLLIDGDEQKRNGFGFAKACNFGFDFTKPKLRIGLDAGPTLFKPLNSGSGICLLQRKFGKNRSPQFEQIFNQNFVLESLIWLKPGYWDEGDPS